MSERRERNISWHAVLCMVILFFAGIACTSKIRWSDRVIPLPKEMVVTDIIRINAGNISYKIYTDQGNAMPLKTMRILLDQFAKGEEGESGLVISVVDLNSRPDAVSRDLYNRLQELKNPAQAYAIVFDKTKLRELTLAANTPVGLLYAARTLNQLVKPKDVDKDTHLVIPLVNIVDWPDIEQRGEWGSGDLTSLDWFSQWKLNMYKVSTYTKKDASGKTTALSVSDVIDSEKLMEWASGLGYTIIPWIIHLGHMSGGAWKGISPPVLSDKDPKPYFPGFCWSDPAVNNLLEEHMRLMAKLIMGTGRDIEVWVTEQPNAAICHCKDCKGVKAYIQEAKAILRAYHKIRKDHPDLRVKIMTSQGSWEVNKQIIELLSPPDEGMTFYDGGRTYTAKHAPMVFPELEAFARAGGLVDVYPITTPDWYACFPGSMPQLIQYRAQEFVDKKLQAVTAYCVYDKFSFEVNMTAWGEYTWNANGRSPYEFARAYATITGFAEPELFARWVEKNGEAAWVLAHLGIIQNFAWDRGFTRIPDAEHEIYSKAVSDAKEALKLAIEADNSLMIVETEAVLAGLKSVELKKEIEQLMEMTNKKNELTEKLRKMDFYAHLIRANVYEWDRLVTENKKKELPETPPAWLAGSWIEYAHFSAYAGTDFMREHGLMMEGQKISAYGMLRATNGVWEKAISMGVKDTRGDMKPVDIAKWTPEDFKTDTVIIKPDVSQLVSESGGKYSLEYYPVAGGEPPLVSEISIVITDTKTGKERIIRHLEPRVTSRYVNSFMLELKRSPDEKVSLTLLLEGTGSNGVIKLRRVWPYSDFPWDKHSILLKE